MTDPDHAAWLEALTLRERAKGQRFLQDLFTKAWSQVIRPRVCGNRTDSPGFFDSCNWNTKAGCLCSKQVEADLANDPYAYEVA
ncbi:hypothetical protein [Nocardioides jensenii]|uniref:hypothetical protein n=1 Tax=Nocardioides jensenii TaxID=1843 RepID=UPI00082D74AB|nr:hypothetical protein [Nocardioides jensenii]